MTPQTLADLHAAAFDRERPWRAAEFEALLAAPHTALFEAPRGFALIRTVAGESELLTLAVHPDARRQGTARRLVAAWLAGLQDVADTAFLDVAADNTGAVALYHQCGFTVAGSRSGYYRRAAGPAADALLMSRAVTLGQTTPAP